VLRTLDSVIIHLSSLLDITIECDHATHSYHYAIVAAKEQVLYDYARVTAQFQ